MTSDLQTVFENPQTRDMQPAVWRDKAGMLHRAVGANVVRGIRLLWTACEKKDIPANAAWLQAQGDNVTCAECLAASVKP